MKYSLQLSCDGCKALGHFLIRQAEPAHYPKLTARTIEHSNINHSSAGFIPVDPETFIECLSEISQSKDIYTSFNLSDSKGKQLSITTSTGHLDCQHETLMSENDK